MATYHLLKVVFLLTLIHYAMCSECGCQYRSCPAGKMCVTGSCITIPTCTTDDDCTNPNFSHCYDGYCE